MSDCYLTDLEKMLIRHEGMRFKPYEDSVGKLTIGVGRNLDDVGITEHEVLMLLAHDIDTAVRGLDRRAPWWIELDTIRRQVLIDMVFNLGINGFMKFKKTIAAIKSKDWEEAALEMMDSKWATQVGGRATELSEMMRTGVAA